MKRTAWVIGLALGAAGLSACQGGQPVTPLPPGAAGSNAPSPARASDTTSSAELAQQRVAAGIADCPRSDPDVAAVPGGLPDLSLNCLGVDSQVRLAGLRGTPMVINVWAQWCGPCRQEAPHLTETANRAGQRIQFLGIDYDDPRPDLAIEFARLAGWRYPQLTDPDRAVAAPLTVIGPPTTVFADAQGRIVYVHAGPVTSTDQLQQMVQQHLGVSL